MDAGGELGGRVDLAADDQFDAFYRREYVRTARLVRLLTGEASVVDDLTQDAFMRVRAATLSIEHPSAFLRAVTVNVCRNWHRSVRRERERMRRAAPIDRVSPAVGAEMDAVMRRLPYRQRAVLVLRYWLDLSEADIASTLECRPGTVKSLHARAMETLRKELDDGE